MNPIEEQKTKAMKKQNSKSTLMNKAKLILIA